MVDVVSYLNTGLSSTPQNKTAESDMDKDAFMSLLVAQMGNQNPLEPMDNTEFISQLAQFSALEQQQNIAAGIELLALTQTASTNSQMVNLIDKRVIVPGNNVSLDGEDGVTLKFNLSEEVNGAELIIKDENGSVVSRELLTEATVGANEFRFDGKDDNGNMLAKGNYTYEIVGSDGAALDGVTKSSNYLIDAVAFEGTSIMLKSEDATIDLGDISEVIKN